MSEVTIFQAKEIVTLWPIMPLAKYVAIKEGNILAVAQELDQMKQWLPNDSYKLNIDFKDAVFVPGFYEPHTHIHALGYFWRYPYVGRFDRHNPQGKLVNGCRTKEEIFERIRQAVAASHDPQKTVIAWGYQPNFYPGDPISIAELDMLAPDRALILVNINLHEMYVNTVALNKSGIKRESMTKGYVFRDKRFTGEVQEEAGAAFYKLFPDISADVLREATKNVFAIAHRVGITTLVDAAFGLVPHAYEVTQDVVHDAGFMRVILCPFIEAIKRNKQVQEDGGLAYIRNKKAEDSPWLKLGAIKIVIDGSLQAKTARLLWPYYLDGSNGIVNMDDRELKDTLVKAFELGLYIMMHANGDEAIESAINATEYALKKVPLSDHRTRIEHCQIPHPHQVKRMQRLGMQVSALSNHMYYWGDIHMKDILGYDRTYGMHPLKSMVTHGISVSLHSDVVSPLSPLLAMSVAVMRKTVSGRSLAPQEALTPLEALKAVTLWPAYQQFEEHCKGSIEVGKYADFTILDKNPLAVSHDTIKDIAVRATVVNGIIFPCD